MSAAGLNVKLIIFLDDILLISATRQEALEARDTVP